MGKLLLLILLFVLTQIPILFITLPADENVYFIISREVAKGHNLYSKIFFAHPPLQIWIYVFLIKLIGFHIWVLKLFTLLVSVGNAMLVYLISKGRYNEKVAIISCFLFLTSYNILVFGSFAFGTEIAVLFFLISFYLLNKNNLLSGLFFALCIMTRLHLAILGVLLLIYAKERVKFMLGASALFIYYYPLTLAPNFVSDVFGYHISKPFFPNGWIAFFRANIHLLVFTAFSFKKVKDYFLLLIGGMYVGFMLILRSVFEYYFLLIIAIMCIEGSVALTDSKYKNIFKLMIVVWIVLLLFRAAPFLTEQNKGYTDFYRYIGKLENKPLIGQSAITSMLALKTDRNISQLQIDTNFQRMKIFDYSGAIVIYEKRVFNGWDFNCTLVSSKDIGDKSYDIWDC